MNEAVKTEGPCVSKADLKGLEELTFPGRLPLDELRIAIAPGAHAAIQTHAKSSLDKEICGVLLGKAKKDAQGMWLVIEDVIEGKDAQGSEAKVTFTPDAWEHIFKEQERRDPSLKMVGWYHTHPRFGIFLSHYDQFIHQNFFGVEPWMVAYVVDPVQDEEGFFFWHRGKTKRVERFWIGDTHRRSDGAEFDGRDLADDRAPPPEETRSPALLAPPAAHGPAAAEVPVAWYRDPFMWVFSTLVLIAVAVWAGFNAFTPSDLEKRVDRNGKKVDRNYVVLQDQLLFQTLIVAEMEEARRASGLPPSQTPEAKALRRLRAEVLSRILDRATKDNPFSTGEKKKTPRKKDGATRPIDLPPPGDSSPDGPPSPPGENQAAPTPRTID